MAEQKEKPIVLVGMMGAGKSTVGREYARRYGLEFIDCDHELEARTGVRIATIFEIEGEEGFRRREKLLLEALLARPGIVLGTGGGVVLSAENRRLLRSRGIVVYLNVPPRVLWERTRHDRSRPLLQVPNPRQRIASLHRERDPLYREVADIVVEGNRGSLSSMVRQVEAAIEKFKQNRHAHSQCGPG